MGQAPSHHDFSDAPETRVEDPYHHPPRGLALIAHGRFATMDSPLVRGLADYFREERQLRVVTWTDRAVGGRDFWSDLAVWTGDVGAGDYNRVLHEAMGKFKADFPDAGGADLFICGYSAGAISAGCARPHHSLVSHFSPARYVLISYPVETNPIISICRSGPYFRSVEALVQGYGWENLPGEFGGREPDVAGVITITGGCDIGPFYGVWTGILGGKNARGNLRLVVVQGAGHVWDGMVDRVVGEVREWLA